MANRPAARLRLPLAAAAALALAVVPVAAVVASPTAPAASVAACAPVAWGSLAKSAPGMSTAPVTGVRTGSHSCYDRLVVDLRGKARGYRVSYVANVYQEGSGAVVPLRGGAKLEIVVLAPAYDASGPTYVPANPRELTSVTGYPTLRQVAWAGSFEGQSTIGLGVRARLPMRAFVLDGPGSGSRLVIDVAHHW